MRRTLIASGLALSSLVAHAHAATILVDPFTAARPANACLPVTQRAIVFSGPWCDGAACPPGDMVTCSTSSAAAQSGLADVLGGARSVGLGGDGVSAASGEVVPADHRFRFATDDSGNATGFWLDYDGGVDDWNLDLPGMGVTGVSASLEGAATSAQPVTCVLSLIDHATGMAQATVELTSPGAFTVPLTAFSAPPGFGWGGIDLIRVAFVNCWRPFGCPGPYPSRAYSIGPVSLEWSSPTPALHRSWGALKATYR